MATASVLSLAQDAINQNIAFPLTGAVLNPDLVGISLSTTITLTAGATQTDQTNAIGQAIAAAQNYINNLATGQELVINDIAAAIRNSSPKIQDVGEPNNQIENIYIWRSRADGSRYSRTLVANYAPALGEQGCSPTRRICSKPGWRLDPMTLFFAPPSQPDWLD